MAIIHKDIMKKYKPSRDVFQTQADNCSYFSSSYCGEKYFQLTWNQGNNIRFDRDTAIFLIDLLIQEFDLQADIKVSFK